MFLAIICAVFAIAILKRIRAMPLSGHNGPSVAIIQHALGTCQRMLSQSVVLRRVFFAYPTKCDPASGPAAARKEVELLVWTRLAFVALFGIVASGVLWLLGPELLDAPRACRTAVQVVVICYGACLQATLLLMILRPVIGSRFDIQLKQLNFGEACKPGVRIDTPRRSLVLTFANFLEIVLTWGVIYRSLLPEQISSLDEANYFSIVTLATLGYGDINPGKNVAAQIAVSLNMLVVLSFLSSKLPVVLSALLSGGDGPANEGPTESGAGGSSAIPKKGSEDASDGL